MNLSNIAQGIWRKTLRSLPWIERHYANMRYVLTCRSLGVPYSEYWFQSGEPAKDAARDGIAICLPNLSGKLSPHLARQIYQYGLGKSCLLVSENKAVADVMRKNFPGVDFVCSDLFADLMDGESAVDFLWDVCSDPVATFGTKRFDSLIANALLEHVIAPTTAVLNMIELLNHDGMIYIMTHTPQYHYHAYPRDYVRFHHDYFHDMADYVGRVVKINIRLVEIFSDRGVICVCYKRFQETD